MKTPDQGTPLKNRKNLSNSWGPFQGGYTGKGNIDMPPLFVNSGEGDVSLQADSPCIDAGTSKDVPTTDIQGASRPQGNGGDMGAYEWSGDSSK